MRGWTIPSIRGQGRDRSCGLFLAQRREGGFQRDLQHLIHRIHEMHLHRIAQIFRDFGKVFFVVAGQDHFE